MASNDDVSTPSAAYKAMAAKWDLAETILGGTHSLRAAGRKYLPQFPRETDKAYEARLALTILTRNMFEEASNKITGKVFKNPVAVENVPSIAEEWLDDIDLVGNSLTRFAQGIFRTALQKGMAHVLVDYPKVPASATRADEKRMGARPYLVRLEPEDVIAVYTKIVDGIERVQHVRYRHTSIERDGWGEKTVERIHVREPGIYQIWEKIKDQDNKESWVMIESGSVTIQDVPFVTFYANRTGVMMAKPPLESVADITLAHWQTGSDYRNILSAVMFPIFYATGIDKGEGDGIAIGPQTLLMAANPGAKFGYAEHSGAAVEVGRKELEDLETRAEKAAMGLFIPKSGNLPATTTAINSAENNSVAQDMAAGLEDALQAMLDFMAEFAKLPSLGDVSVSKSFDSELGATDMDKLLMMYDRGIVSGDAVRQAAKARNVLPEDFDEEADALKRQEEDLAKMAGNADDEDEDETDDIDEAA